MINLKKYRDPWMAEGFDKYIGFYTREFYALDNFSSFKIMYNGTLYSSVEEGYQAEKFEDPEIKRLIIQSMSADEAKRVAHKYDEKKKDNWDEIKLEVMEDLLRVKLAQHEYVKKKLLQTKDYLIVEDSPVDSFWGIGANRDGENHLGKIWMKIRAELMESNDNNSQAKSESEECSASSLEELLNQAIVDGEPESWHALREYLDEMEEGNEEEFEELKRAIDDVDLEELYRTLYFTFECRLSVEEYERFRRKYYYIFDPEVVGYEVFPDRSKEGR